jgi:hypothetical protein
MKRTEPTKGVSVQVVRDAHVPHLWMDQAMHHELSIDHTTATNAGSDGQVNKSVKPAGSTPPVLTQSSAIHVCIKAHWYVEGPANSADNISSVST